MGLVTRPHAHPPHPQPVGSEFRPDAPKDEPSGVGERPTLDAPSLRKKQPPRAPSCHLHSAQSQLARARGVGLVTGPHAYPPHPQPVGSGPRPHAPKDERSGVGEGLTLDAPRLGKRCPPPGALVPAPQGAKPARKGARCRVRDGSLRPHPPHPQPVGSGPRQHAPKNKRPGVGERPTRDAPHPGKRRPRRRPRAAPEARKSSSQERAGWGW